MKPSKSKRPTTARRPRRKCNTCGELLEALEKEAPPPVNVRALEDFRASRSRRLAVLLAKGKAERGHKMTVAEVGGELRERRGRQF